MFSAARRRNGYAGLHDLVMKTRVVLRPRAVEARTAVSRAAADHRAAAGGDRLGPYVVEPGVKPMALSAPVVVQGYDDRLRRPIWVEMLPPGTPPLEVSRRDLGRPARTRWLSGRRADGECWDAYEAVEGQPFPEAAVSPQPWSRVRHWLADLSGEIAAGMKDGSLPLLHIDRIWIGSDDRARLLDWPPPSPADTARASAGQGRAGTAPTPDPRSRIPSPREAQQFLYGLVAGALRGVDPDTARAAAVAIPLPITARALLQKLRDGGVDSLETVRAEAETQLRNPADVPILRRAIQVALCGMLTLLMPVVVIGAILLLQRSQTGDPEAFALKACTGKLASFEKLGAKMTVKQQQDREAIEVYIAEHLSDAVVESAAVARAFPAVNRARGEHALAERAIANHPQRSPAQVKKADEVVAKLIADQSKGLTVLQTPLALLAIAVAAAAFASAFVGVVALLGSLTARGGFTFRPFGTALVREDGSPAGRIRAFLRALMSWCPAAVLCTLVVLGPGPNSPDLTLTLLNTAILLLFIGCAAWAILHPSRGIQDRFAGTWIVPR